MDQDSLDFNIKLNDEQTVPDVQEEKPQVKLESQGYSKQNSILTQDTRANNQDSDLNSNNFDINAAAHPTMCIMTFIFKGLAMFCYFFLNAVISDSIFTFIIVLLLCCFDFWTVKNITARFLVGLKWWNEFDEEGKEIWLYSSMPVEWEAHQVDKTIFWTSQIVAVLFFGIMLFIKILSLDFFWALLNTICLSLFCTNFWGFYKCRGQHQKKGKELMGKVGLKVLSRF